MKYAREVRQLWDVADRYFKEAEKLRNKHSRYLDHNSCKIRDLERSYEKKIPGQLKRELNFLGAHLSSAAIRLCTISDRCPTGIIRDYKKDDLRGSQSDLAKILKKNINKYLPYMLRDNVAHIERAKPKERPLWEARQDVIEDLQIIGIFSFMKSIIDDFRNWLSEGGFLR